MKSSWNGTTTYRRLSMASQWNKENLRLNLQDSLQQKIPFTGKLQNAVNSKGLFDFAVRPCLQDMADQSSIIILHNYKKKSRSFHFVICAIHNTNTSATFYIHLIHTSILRLTPSFVYCLLGYYIQGSSGPNWSVYTGLYANFKVVNWCTRNLRYRLYSLSPFT